uniref:Uncharacterized protein n=1 Tax=Bombyx mori TaxID=7091 RepID=A0A8R2RAW3_BOMMO|nr:uncharacterized protein LOC119630467 [Bombyx mori]
MASIFKYRMEAVLVTKSKKCRRFTKLWLLAEFGVPRPFPVWKAVGVQQKQEDIIRTYQASAIMKTWSLYALVTPCTISYRCQGTLRSRHRIHQKKASFASNLGQIHQKKASFASNLGQLS